MEESFNYEYPHGNEEDVNVPSLIFPPAFPAPPSESSWDGHGFEYAHFTRKPTFQLARYLYDRRDWIQNRDPDVRLRSLDYFSQSSNSVHSSPLISAFNPIRNANAYPPEQLQGKAWSDSDLLSNSLADFENAVIGVEATSYLQNLIDNPPSHEPLLAALGGEPMTFRHYIESELKLWKENKMKPLFVFDGQTNVGKDEMALKRAQLALKQTQHAWTLYGDNRPDEAVKAFGASGAARAQDLYRLLQEILTEQGLEFVIAPFGACAQLAYLESLETQYIDGIMGSQELLLYDIDDCILLPPSAAHWDSKKIVGISKSEIIRRLNVTPEVLADALLMIGTSFLPPFPPLSDRNIISLQPFTVKDAANLLRTSEKSVNATCAAFSDILQLQDPNWLDKFRKAKMIVKHCGTVRENGDVQIKDFDRLTVDNREYLGMQLPAELYYYLSKALIGPRIMNSFLLLGSLVLPTFDGVVSDEYRKLVGSTLVPLKETATTLIVSRIHRAFQYKDITLKFWFDDNFKATMVPKNLLLQTPTNKQADSWKVKESVLQEAEKATGLSAGTLSFALISLLDNDFPSKTITDDKDVKLETESEIVSNVLWRVLHLRGYINDEHKLTSWGKALATTLKAVRGDVKAYKDIHHIQEAAFLAFELLRFDNLNSRNRHSELIGGPLRGDDADKASCILIGRTACLLKIRHNNVGYTGPLSKNLLSFYSIIKAVRETDRDLVEAAAASMFLNGHGNRERKDFAKIGKSLPLSTDIDIAFGIAVKTYLDDFVEVNATAEEKAIKKPKYIDRYLPFAVNWPEDLQVAMNFFDALHAGVKTLEGGEIPEADRKAWDEAGAWLAARK
ncbi:hypothetical protein HYALB_00009525 [Hymenoscyphus albidus]|uniref:Uncharacterized protein n=1 Tax=Hymenoscyphus albidus TaxID=595503 RepID=A0A9N9LN59_9HELO|nr:hypothetical protein HYALB_00009525 [Hymenoscyphus albidus]